MLTYKTKHHVLASLQNKTLQTGRYFCKIAKKTPHNYINIFFQKVCLGWNKNIAGGCLLRTHAYVLLQIFSLKATIN